jgi:hypothetical protein
MTTTPKLGIPLISSQQASPEITHNQMVVLLQALAGGAKEERNSPPVSPAEGDCYIVGGVPTGAFIGHTHAIAVYFGGWNFIPGYDDDGVIIPMTAAQNGLSIFNNDTGELWAWETSSWVVVTGGTGASRLIDLLDVMVSETASENGDYLVWNEAAGKWVNQNPPRLIDLSDVAASETSTIDGDFLAWDDGLQKWVPTPINFPSEAGVPNLSDLPDVDIVSPIDGDVLTFDQLSGKWVAAPPAPGPDSENSGDEPKDRMWVIEASGNFTTPADSSFRTVYRYRAVGGGAGGVGNSQTDAFYGAPGGGSGGIGEGYFTNVGAGVNIAITIGAKGIGGTSAPTVGTAGGNTTIGSPLAVTARGGAVALATVAAAAQVGGLGGVVTGADLNIQGGQGGASANSPLGSGFGGSNALGAGGGQAIAGGTAGTPGKKYGGGGSGGRASGGVSVAGGDGEQGVVIIERVSG